MSTVCLPRAARSAWHPLLPAGRKPGMNKKPTPRFNSASEPTEEQIERGKAFAAWLNNAVTRAGININVLHQKVGNVSTTYLYKLAKGGIDEATGGYRRPSSPLVHAIAEATGANVNDGLRAAGYDTGELPPPPASLMSLPPESHYALQQFLATLPNVIQPLGAADTLIIPVIGTVSAGKPLYAVENVRERIPIPRSMVNRFDESTVFAVRVKGDCLTGIHIASGDLLICRQAEAAKDMDIVVVVSDTEEAVAKRYRENPGKSLRWLETVPAFGNPEKIILDGTPRIIGVKVGLYREG